MHENQNERDTWETGQEWKEQKGAETPRRDRYKGGNGHTRTEKGLGRDLGPHRSLLGAPQRRDQAQVTLGRSPHCPRGSRLARAIPDRLLEAGPLGGVWEPLEPGGQATGKLQTGSRPLPTITLPPRPAPLMNWDLIHNITAGHSATVWLQRAGEGQAGSGVRPGAH